MENKWNTEPDILRESSAGFYRSSISELMLENREIQCVGELAEELAYSIIRQLLYLQRKNSEAEITMYMDCTGGKLSAGLMIYDVMKTITCPIRTVCMGHLDRSAAIVFSASNRRQMFLHGAVTLYEPQTAGCSIGYGTSHSSSTQQGIRAQEEVARILAEQTGKTVEQIKQQMQNDTVFFAEEAVAFGLADEVLAER